MVCSTQISLDPFGKKSDFQGRPCRLPSVLGLALVMPLAVSHPTHGTPATPFLHLLLVPSLGLWQRDFHL